MFPCFLAAFLLFTSCQKDSNSEDKKSPCRLVKVTQGLDPIQDSIYMFKYNENGLPSEINLRFNPTLNFNWLDFVYKPGTSILDKIVDRTPTNSHLFLYEYNAQNKLVKCSDFLGKEFSYQYNEKGLLNRVDVADRGIPKSYYYQTFFDDKGNMTSYYVRNVSDDKPISSVTMEYSNDDNTLQLLGTLNIGQLIGANTLFPGSDLYPVPSKKLPKSMTYRNAKDEPVMNAYHSFEKDAANNIISAIVTYKNMSAVFEVNTWKLEYDCPNE